MGICFVCFTYIHFNFCLVVRMFYWWRNCAKVEINIFVWWFCVYCCVVEILQVLSTDLINMYRFMSIGNTAISVSVTPLVRGAYPRLLPSVKTPVTLASYWILHQIQPIHSNILCAYNTSTALPVYLHYGKISRHHFSKLHFHPKFSAVPFSDDNLIFPCFFYLLTHKLKS